MIDFPGAGVEWPTTTVKYTEWGRNDIRITTRIGGPNSAIEYRIQAPGDLYVEAPKGSPRALLRRCDGPSRRASLRRGDPN